MLRSTIEYINKHKFVVVLIIILIGISLVYLYYRLNLQTESPNINNPTTPQQPVLPPIPQSLLQPSATVIKPPVSAMPKVAPAKECCPCPIINTIDKYVSENKYVNIKTRIGETDYYLATMPNLNCSGFQKSWEECNNNVVVLVPSSWLDKQLQTYKNNLEDETKRCNFDAKLKCERDKPKSDSCNINYPQCEKKRHFISDFQIKEIVSNTPDSTAKSYKLMGSPLSMSNIDSPTYLVNQIGGATENNMLCADSLPSVNNFMVGINFIESTTKGKFKLRFNRQVRLNKSLLFDTKTGAPKLEFAYVGKCANKDCNFDNNKLTRVCLYRDSIDPNVLEFDISTLQ